MSFTILNNKIIKSNFSSTDTFIQRYESENLLNGRPIELSQGEAAIITVNGRIYGNGIITEAGRSSLETGNGLWTQFPFIQQNTTQLYFIRTHNMPLQDWHTTSNTNYRDPGARNYLANVSCRGTYSWSLEGEDNILKFIKSGIITGGLNQISSRSFRDINGQLSQHIGNETIPAIMALTNEKISLREVNAHNLQRMMFPAVKKMLLEKYGITLNEFNIENFIVKGSREWDAEIQRQIQKEQIMQQQEKERLEKKTQLWYDKYNKIYRAEGQAEAIRTLGNNWQFMQFIDLIKSMAKGSTPSDINNFVNTMLGQQGQQANGFATILQTLMNQGNTAASLGGGQQAKGLPNQQIPPSLLEPLEADEGNSKDYRSLSDKMTELKRKLEAGE